MLICVWKMNNIKCIERNGRIPNGNKVVTKYDEYIDRLSWIFDDGKLFEVSWKIVYCQEFFNTLNFKRKLYYVLYILCASSYDIPDKKVIIAAIKQSLVVYICFMLPITPRFRFKAKMRKKVKREWNTPSSIQLNWKIKPQQHVLYDVSKRMPKRHQ